MFARILRHLVLSSGNRRPPNRPLQLTGIAGGDAARRGARLQGRGAYEHVHGPALYRLNLEDVRRSRRTTSPQGVDAGTLAERDRDSPLLKLLSDFRNDSDIIALAQAGIDADVPKMLLALPAGRTAYELHLAGLDRWITSIGRGAILSSKVIQVADITMLARGSRKRWATP